MKRVLTLILIFITNTVFAENSIVSIVNNTVITYKSIEATLLEINSNKSKIDVINQKIDSILQLQKAKELNMQASPNDVNKALLEISKTNNLSLEQLRSYPEYSLIENEVLEKISILNLQRYITRDINISEDVLLNKCSKNDNDSSIKQIKIAQIIISEVKINNEKNQDEAIKLFLNKLSTHINKGASFEALAKLHSQHQSYENGGVSEWIEVNTPIIKMLDSLQDSEVSKIYLTNAGFAIGIKLEERFISSNLKKCKEKLIYRTAEKFYSNWVKNLREDAYIKIYYENL